MIFGTFVPQGWKMELAGIADPQEKWSTTVHIAKEAERLGYDSVWVYDHFHNVPVPAQETMFECWTTLAAISQVTSRVRLGQMVSCALYRNPAMVAKITSSIDVISGGRLDWGIGAGWYDQEFRAYGYEYPSNADRIRMLRETVEIVKLMWSEGRSVPRSICSRRRATRSNAAISRRRVFTGLRPTRSRSSSSRMSWTFESR